MRVMQLETGADIVVIPSERLILVSPTLSRYQAVEAARYLNEPVVGRQLAGSVLKVPRHRRYIDGAVLAKPLSVVAAVLIMGLLILSTGAIRSGGPAITPPFEDPRLKAVGTMWQWDCAPMFDPATARTCTNYRGDRFRLTADTRLQMTYYMATYSTGEEIALYAFVDEESRKAWQGSLWPLRPDNLISADDWAIKSDSEGLSARWAQALSARGD